MVVLSKGKILEENESLYSMGIYEEITVLALDANNYQIILILSFKYRKNKILITLLFILNQFNIISPDYISIPFKIYQEDLTTLNFESQLKSEYISNKIYFPIQIGKTFSKCLWYSKFL